MYWFKALKNGVVINQKIESDSEQDVVDYLKRNDYVPIKVQEIKPLLPELMTMFDRIGFGDIVDFTRQLAIMLNAGLTLIDSFSILQKKIYPAQQVGYSTNGPGLPHTHIIKHRFNVCSPVKKIRLEFELQKILWEIREKRIFIAENRIDLRDFDESV